MTISNSPAREDDRVHDPWLIAGLLLLALLSIGAVLVYRSAPQTLAEASTGSWLAATPNAAAANLARARERLERAREAAQLGEDSIAATIDSVAAAHAWRAAELASDSATAMEALAVWAEAQLNRAEHLRILGTGVGLRLDDNETLRRAVDIVNEVDSISPDPAARAQADSLRNVLERQLRPGPLRWLP